MGMGSEASDGEAMNSLSLSFLSHELKHLLAKYPCINQTSRKLQSFYGWGMLCLVWLL
jgi:hypothetical protein